MYVYLLQFGKYMREERFKHRDIDRFDSSVPIYMACDYTADKEDFVHRMKPGKPFLPFYERYGSRGRSQRTSRYLDGQGQIMKFLTHYDLQPIRHI